MITIDKDVPRITQKHTPLYPWGELEVDESFFVPASETPNIKNRRSYWEGKTGFWFETRQVTENGVKGTRIWRVK